MANPNPSKRLPKEFTSHGHPGRTNDKRWRDDETKAVALIAVDLLDGNVAAAARVMEMPRKTLERWTKNTHGQINDHTRVLYMEGREKMLEMLQRISMKIYGELEAKVDAGEVGGNIQQWANAATIIHNAAQVMAGEPTNITATVDAARNSVRDKIARLTPKVASEE